MKKGLLHIHYLKNCHLCQVEVDRRMGELIKQGRLDLAEAENMCFDSMILWLEEYE